MESVYNQILQQLFKSKAGEKAANQKTLHHEIEKLKERLNRAQQLMLDGEMEMLEYREIKRSIEPKIDSLLRQQQGFNQVEGEYKGHLKKGLSVVKNLSYLFDN